MTTPYRCRDRGSLSATSASFHCTVVVRLGAPAKRKILTYGLATVFHVVTSRVLWRQGARNWAVGDTLTPISRHVGQRSRNYPVWIGYGLSPEGSELNQKPWDLNISHLASGNGAALTPLHACSSTWILRHTGHVYHAWLRQTRGNELPFRTSELEGGGSRSG